MKEVRPLDWFGLFAHNMRSRYNWDVASADGFDPEAPKVVFVIRKSYGQLTARKIAETVKRAVISKKG